jgi:formate dehydrogenase subunit gamma
MIATAVVLPLTGIVMWFPEYVPRSIHWLLPVMVFFHSVAALVSVGMIIIHVYMGTVIVPGSWRAITLGYVSRGWAMLHHALWYRKMTRGEERK